MSQPTYEISANDVVTEAIRMELATLAKDRFFEVVSLEDAAKSLADKLICKAKRHGIEALTTTVTRTRDSDGWTLGDPNHYEVHFDFPNEDHAVWFRTMIL